MATSSSIAHRSSSTSSTETHRSNAARESRLPRSVPASPRQSVTSFKLDTTPHSSLPAPKARDEHRATSSITTKGKAPSHASRSPRSSSSNLSRASSPNTEQSGYDRGLKGTNATLKGQGSTESEPPTNFPSAASLLKEILYFLKNDEEWRLHLAPGEEIQRLKLQPVYESEAHHQVEAQMQMLESQLKQEPEVCQGLKEQLETLNSRLAQESERYCEAREHFEAFNLRLSRESDSRVEVERKVKILQDRFDAAEQTMGQIQMTDHGDQEQSPPQVEGQLIEQPGFSESSVDGATREGERASTEEDVKDWQAKYESLQLERDIVQQDFDRISALNDNLFDLAAKVGKENDAIKAENNRLEKENERLEKELDTYRIQERYRKENAPKCATTQTEDIVAHFSSQSTQTDLMDLTPQPLVSPDSQDDTLNSDPQLRQDDSMLSTDFPVTQEPPANALQSDNDTTTELHREMEIDDIPASQAEVEIGDQAMICTTQQLDVTKPQDVELEHAAPESPLSEPLETPTVAVVECVQPHPMEQQHPKETKARKRNSKHNKDRHRSQATKRRGRSSFDGDRDHAIKKKSLGRGQPHRKHRHKHERENPSASGLVLCRSPRKPSSWLERLLRKYQYWVARPQDTQKCIGPSNLLTG